MRVLAGEVVLDGLVWRDVIDLLRLKHVVCVEVGVWGGVSFAVAVHVQTYFLALVLHL